MRNGQWCEAFERSKLTNFVYGTIMTIYLFAKRQKSLKNPKQLYIQLHNY